MHDLGRVLIVLGVALVLVGILIHYSGALSFLRLGRLPGDISIKRDSFRFYFPITTSIIVSVVLTLILYLLRK
jgi:hypothetical protein